MISLEDFSQLLKALYATPLQPEEWTTFLNLLASLTGSSGCYLLVADRSQGLSIRMQGGTASLSDEALRKYAEIAPADPYRLPALKLDQTGVIDMDSLVQDHELVKTEMFQYLLKPTGLKYPTAMLLTGTVNRMEVVSLWRSEEQGKLSTESWRLLELLVPHVQAVLEVRRKLGVIRDQLKGVEAVADASPCATLLVSGTGKLLHANAEAKLLLDEADGLCVEKTKLRAANPAMTAGLQGLIRRAASGSEAAMATVPTSTMLLQRSTSRGELQVMASPVPGLRRNGLATVLLVVNDPERPVTLPEDAMRELYGLTAAEVEVASGLLTGYSLEEIAALRKVAVGTVRMQLKSIFTKTKTHRQAELVRLLAAMPGAR